MLRKNSIEKRFVLAVRRNLEQTLKEGGVAVIPTDTIYGIVASALNKSAVEKVYRLKKRNSKKPVLILLSNIKEIENFGGILPRNIKIFKRKKTTVVLPIRKSFLKKYEYLHRGHKTVGFRIPFKKSLLALLKKTGPLIAPSANPEGLTPPETISKAKDYFGKKVDYYLGGRVSKRASSIVELLDKELIILRK